jgi:hypothetical protein
LASLESRGTDPPEWDSGLELTGGGAAAIAFLRFRLPRRDRCDPCFCPASDAPGTVGFTPDSGSLTFLIHHAAQDPKAAAGASLFNVGANVSASHEFAKFFFGPD